MTRRIPLIRKTSAREINYELMGERIASGFSKNDFCFVWRLHFLLNMNVNFAFWLFYVFVFCWEGRWKILWGSFGNYCRNSIENFLISVDKCLWESPKSILLFPINHERQVASKRQWHFEFKLHTSTHYDQNIVSFFIISFQL